MDTHLTPWVPPIPLKVLYTLCQMEDFRSNFFSDGVIGGTIGEHPPKHGVKHGGTHGVSYPIDGVTLRDHARCCASGSCKETLR